MESKDAFVANHLPHISLKVGIINVPNIEPTPNID